MKKRFFKIAALSLAIMVTGGCTGGGRGKRAPGVHVLATFLPMYIFTVNVAQGVPGVDVDVMLSFAAGCPHDYQLRPGDAKKLAGADALIANGGIESFLGEGARRINPRIKVLVTNEGLDTMADAGGGRARNPHTWVSAPNAQKQVLRIRDFLSGLDPAHRGAYAANAARYNAELEALWREVRAKTAEFPNKKIATFHDAFDYFARDAGLQIEGYIEPAPGQAPSAGEAAALAAKLKTTRAAAIFSEPQYPSRMADAIAAEAGIPVYALDPMSQTDFDPPPADLYQKVMRGNLAVLERALGERGGR